MLGEVTGYNNNIFTHTVACKSMLPLQEVAGRGELRGDVLAVTEIISILILCHHVCHVIRFSFPPGGNLPVHV